MEAIVVYLLKSLLISALFTGWYFIGLRNRQLHRYNRFYLLAALAASLLLPLLQFSLYQVPASVATGLPPMPQMLQATAVQAPDSSAATPAASVSFNWAAAVTVFYGIITLALLAMLVKRVYGLLLLTLRYPVVRRGGINVIITDIANAPFTFLNYMFWKRSIPMDSEAGRTIYKHEAAHITQGHSYDKLACQVLTCLFWFNPFFWVMQKELGLVHEFLADEAAVADRDTGTFALMVLQAYNNGSYLMPQHHFSASATRRRLQMLQCNAAPRFSSARRWALLPLTGLLVTLFSCRIGSSPQNMLVSVPAQKAAKKIIVLVDAAHGGEDLGATSLGYTEKDICLMYAKRLNELAPDHNIEVLLTRDADKSLKLARRVDMTVTIKPDVFLSLHVGNEPGTEPAKGDFDIYVSGTASAAKASSTYGASIFGAMQQSGIIPGITPCKHPAGEKCANCRPQGNNAVTAKQRDGIFLLKNSSVPSLVLSLGNINDRTAMQQLTSPGHMEALCAAILNGLVAGNNQLHSGGLGYGRPVKGALDLLGKPTIVDSPGCAPALAAVDVSQSTTH